MSCRPHLLWTLFLSLLVNPVAAVAEDAWEVLFDGTSTSAWRGFRQAEFPTRGWVIDQGTLHFQKGSQGGDIVTRKSYASFELEFDWKVAPGANSGVMYRVSEEGTAPWHTGPEYQILDDSRHPDGRNPLTSTAALYALIPAAADKPLQPVGDWNTSRIVVRGQQAEHWLNGTRVVAFTLGSPDLDQRIAGSKFKDLPRFAREPAGLICLQDHGDDVWYRNIRIRPLLVPDDEGWISLFDGRTTQGWRGFGKPGFPERGWEVQDGWLRHVPKAGGGDIITTATFNNFEFACEWRIAPGGNSGIKYLINERHGSPIGHEYQVIDDSAHPDAEAGPKRHTASLYDALPPENAVVKPAGEINETRIIVRDRQVEHWLNGRRVLHYTLESPELNAAKAASKFKDTAHWGTKFPTPILLQDHQDEVWYRHLRIRPLP